MLIGNMCTACKFSALHLAMSDEAILLVTESRFHGDDGESGRKG